MLHRWKRAHPGASAVDAGQALRQLCQRWEQMSEQERLAELSLMSGPGQELGEEAASSQEGEQNEHGDGEDTW
eukprot:995035-Lingulodinium_polyedra.AAC.1